jgi:hypothetical protein
MLVYDIERWGWIPTLDEHIILSEKLKKLQIPRLSDEIFQKILADSDTKKSFSRDIDSISSQIPPNPSEILRIELLYINGIWQEAILKDGSKISFYQLSRLWAEKQNIIIEQIDDEIADKLEKYIRSSKLQDENKRVKMNRWVETTVTVKDRQEKLKMNSELDVQIEAIQKIDWVPKPDIVDLKKSAADIPELKWVNPLDIASGKYDSVIVSDYYIRNNDIIIKGIDQKDRELFTNSINNLSDTLGRPRPVPWPDIISKWWLALEPNRDKIKSAGDKAVSEWYNKSVVWDSQSRSLIFRGDRWEKIIETASLPPRERIVKNTLSISREIDPISPDTQIRQWLEQTRDRLSSIVTRDRGNILLAPLENTLPEWLEKNPSVNVHKQNQEIFRNAWTPEEKIAAIKKLRLSNHELDIARRWAMTPENMNDPRSTELERSLYREQEGMNSLDISLGKLTDTTEKMKNYPVAPWDTNQNFDIYARSTLSYLSLLGYDILGQRSLDQIIAAINLEKENEIWSIDLSKNPKLTEKQQRELLRVIARLSRISPQTTTVETDDTMSDALLIDQFHSPNWRPSIQNLGKNMVFQQRVAGPLDSFQKYLYQKSSPPEFLTTQKPLSGTLNSSANLA